MLSTGVDNSATPTPWHARVRESVFEYHHSSALRAIFSRQHDALRSRMVALGNRTEHLFVALRAAGLVTSPLGIDASHLQARRYATAPAAILADPALRQALDLLVFPTDQQLEGTAVVPRTLWARDQPARGLLASGRGLASSTLR